MAPWRGLAGLACILALADSSVDAPLASHDNASDGGSRPRRRQRPPFAARVDVSGTRIADGAYYLDETADWHDGAPRYRRAPHDAATATTQRSGGGDGDEGFARRGFVLERRTESRQAVDLQVWSGAIFSFVVGPLRVHRGLGHRDRMTARVRQAVTTLCVCLFSPTSRPIQSPSFCLCRARWCGLGGGGDGVRLLAGSERIGRGCAYVGAALGGRAHRPCCRCRCLGRRRRRSGRRLRRRNAVCGAGVRRRRRRSDERP